MLSPSSSAILFLSVILSIENITAYNVLIIGGTRFSGASLWKELHSRKHSITVYNRGKTAPKPVTRETDEEFQQRIAAATYIKGDRGNAEQLKASIDPSKYDYVFDMNARELPDVAPLAELFVGKSQFKQYVFMSSAGVYKKSEEMPHLEINEVDPKSRHKGKLDCEQKLAALGLPWCSFRPTYICGPQNYNPVERYFFERVTSGRPVCIPGHGQHLTGLGHVEDLAVAMANVIGREDRTTGNVYNVQNTQAITFDGVAKAAAKAAGLDPSKVEIIHYDPKKVTFPEDKKGFPMRPQHFFTGIHKAMKDLEWAPKYDTVDAIFKDAYENDFVILKDSGKLKSDFTCDDIVIGSTKALA
jgi:nucleoside-diphosphate-sugar epimerase